MIKEAGTGRPAMKSAPNLGRALQDCSFAINIMMNFIGLNKANSLESTELVLILAAMGI